MFGSMTDHLRHGLGRLNRAVLMSVHTAVSLHTGVLLLLPRYLGTYHGICLPRRYLQYVGSWVITP